MNNTIKISKLTHIISREAYRCLEFSVEKWDLIVQGRIPDSGPKNCMLCQLFNNPKESNDPSFVACTGKRGERCPIYLDTSNPDCWNYTPYGLFRYLCRVDADKYVSGWVWKENWQYAVQMRDYLRNLLSLCKVDPESMHVYDSEMQEIETYWTEYKRNSVHQGRITPDFQNIQELT